VTYVFAPRRSAADSANVADSTVRALGMISHEDDRFLLVRVDSGAVVDVRR
jgi:hypothetical protein